MKVSRRTITCMVLLVVLAITCLFFMGKTGDAINSYYAGNSEDERLIIGWGALLYSVLGIILVVLFLLFDKNAHIVFRRDGWEWDNRLEFFSGYAIGAMTYIAAVFIQEGHHFESMVTKAVIFGLLTELILDIYFVVVMPKIEDALKKRKDEKYFDKHPEMILP